MSTANNELSRAVLQTREVEAAFEAALPAVLEAWAGDGRRRRLLAWIAKRLLAGGFSADKEQPSLAEVLAEPERVGQLMQGLVAVINSALGPIRAGVGAAAALADAQRAQIAATCIEELDWPRIGEILGDLVRLAAASQHSEQGTAAEQLRQPLRALVEAIDFGDLKEAIEAGGDSAVAVASMANEELWRYPAKVLCMLSTLPAVASAGMRVATGSVAQVNALAPDLVADVVLSMVRNARGEEMAALINELSELARKVHTGGALLGQGGSSRLPTDISAALALLLASLDLGLLLRTRRLLADTAEEVEEALLDDLPQYPELAREMVGARFRSVAVSARRLARRLEAVEQTLDGDEIAAQMTAAIGELDAQALAEAVNLVLGQLNRLAEVSPGALRDLVSQTIEGIEPHEAQQAAARITTEMVAALEPLAPQILPPVIRGLADLLSTADAHPDDEMRSAVSALRSAILGTKVAS